MLYRRAQPKKKNPQEDQLNGDSKVRLKECRQVGMFVCAQPSEDCFTFENERLWRVNWPIWVERPRAGTKFQGRFEVPGVCLVRVPGGGMTRVQ